MAVILTMCRSIVRSKCISLKQCLPASVAGQSYSTTNSSGSTVPHAQKDPLDLSFENTVDAFKSKTTWEIFRAILVLKLSTFDYLVENHQKVCMASYNVI